MSTFRVTIPGFGFIYATAGSAGQALAAAQLWLNRNRITVETGLGSPTVIDIGIGAVPPGEIHVNAAGNIATPPLPAPEMAPPQPSPVEDPGGSGGQGVTAPAPQPTPPVRQPAPAPALPQLQNFRVTVPGFGTVFVSATTPDRALTGVQLFLNRNRITVESGSGLASPVPIGNSAPPSGAIFINASGGRISGPVFTPPPVVEPEPDPEPIPEPVVPAEPVDDGGEDPGGTGVPLPVNFRGTVVGFPPIYVSNVLHAGQARDAITQFIAASDHARPDVVTVQLVETIPAGAITINIEAERVDGPPLDSPQNDIEEETGDDVLTGGGGGEDPGGGGLQPLNYRVDIADFEFGPIYVERASTEEVALEAVRSFLSGKSIAVQGPITATETALPIPSGVIVINTLGTQQRGPNVPIGGGGGSEQPVDETPPETGPVDPTGPTGPSQDPAFLGELTQPFGAFQKAVAGLGVDPQGLLGGAVSDLFRPTLSTFLFGTLTGDTTPGGSATPLQDFVAQSGLTAIPGTAASVFENLVNRTASPEANQAFLEQLQQGVNAGVISQAALEQAMQAPDLFEFLGSVSPGSALGGNLQNLAQGALAGRTTPLFASLFGTQFINRLVDNFNRQVAAGAIDEQGNPTGSFLDFLASGLGTV